jgi:5-methylcytosine-specific restriction protein A
VPRNPPWEADELVLALDVYLRVPEARRSKSHPEIAELSKTLRALPLPIDRPDPAKFRNVNGAFLKLQNFKALDPEYTAGGRVGMRRGATGREQALWDRFVDNQDELRELAAGIREGSAAANLPTQREDDEEGVLEGRLVWRWHRQRERAPTKAAEKKARMRAALGELQCEVCELSEAQAKARFGAFSGDIFECHHTKPLYTLTGTTTTRVADLAVVCPTCHRALHRVEPPISVAEMNARVRSGT